MDIPAPGLEIAECAGEMTESSEAEHAFKSFSILEVHVKKLEFIPAVIH